MASNYISAILLFYGAQYTGRLANKEREGPVDIFVVPEKPVAFAVYDTKMQVMLAEYKYTMDYWRLSKDDLVGDLISKIKKWAAESVQDENLIGTINSVFEKPADNPIVPASELGKTAIGDGVLRGLLRN